MQRFYTKNGKVRPITPRQQRAQQYQQFTPDQLLERYEHARQTDNRAEKVRLKMAAVSAANRAKAAGNMQLYDDYRLVVNNIFIPKYETLQTRNNHEKQHYIQSSLDYARRKGDYGAYDAEQEKLLKVLQSLDGKPAKAYEAEILKRKRQLMLDQTSPNRNFYAEVVDKEIISSLEKVYGKPVKPKAKFVLDKSSKTLAYNQDSAKLVYMTPQQYLDLATRNQMWDRRSIENLSSRMMNSQEIDPLWFDVDVTTNRVTSHEGRHRAQTAKMLEIKKVPVILYARDANGFTSKNKLPPIEKLERQLG